MNRIPTPAADNLVETHEPNEPFEPVSLAEDNIPAPAAVAPVLSTEPTDRHERRYDLKHWGINE